MNIEREEALAEMEQNRAFEVLERHERLKNAQTINDNNQAAAELHHSAAELNVAKAKFLRSLGTVLIATWAAALVTGWFWVIYHIVK